MVHCVMAWRMHGYAQGMPIGDGMMYAWSCKGYAVPCGMGIARQIACRPLGGHAVRCMLDSMSDHKRMHARSIRPGSE